MPIPAPSHLCLQGSVYHFRMSSPHRLRALLGMTEVKRSLATPYLKQARVRATAVATRRD